MTRMIARWRPARVPKDGTHGVQVVTADRAGNVGSVSGTIRVAR